VVADIADRAAGVYGAGDISRRALTVREADGLVGGAAYLSGMSSSRSSAGGGFAGLFGVLLLIGIIIKFIWWILGAVALVVVFFIARSAVRWYDERRATEARYRDGLAARADQQHNWVMRGDERGIYGTEGAKLMHYLYGNSRHG
jgi:hypothetical protein